MDEIVAKVIAATGINKEQAEGAIKAVLGYVQDKLPAPLAQQFEGLLQGAVLSKGVDQVESLMENDTVKNALGSIGGMFGKKD